MFPDEPAVLFVHDVLRKCIVEFENETRLRDASKLLAEVDAAIAAVSHGCQVRAASLDARRDSPDKTGSLANAGSGDGR